MAAQRKQEDSTNPEDERLDLFVAPYQAEYSEAISAAREACKTTATDGWRENYKHNMEDHRKSVKHEVSHLASIGESISAYDTNEEAEKLIGDAKKRLADERIRFNAWRARAVSVYEQSAKKCTAILERMMREASDEERENMLTSRGLVASVQGRIATWPHAEWNDEEGVVVIEERKAT